MAGLHFVQTGDNSQLLTSLAQSRKAFGQLEASAQATGQTIDSVFSNAKGIALQIASAAGLATGGVSLLTKVVGTRSEFQNTEAMFKVFLRDAEKASAFMDEIQKYAFNNVFDFGDLTKQAAQLMAYGTAQENVIDILDRLSNVAAGVNVPLAELVNSYNKVKATDTLDSRMMESLSAKGIRVRQILADIRTEETGAKVVEKDLEGVVLHFDDLQKVLKRVTDEGGMYYGMMEEKMKTLGDSVGLLQDRVMGMFNEMGKKVQEPLREMIYGAADLVENWEEVIKTLAEVAAMYGVVKAAMAFEKAWNNAEAMYALNAEKEMTQSLTQTIKDYEKAVLQAQIADLKAAQSKGTLTAAEHEQLLQKENELTMLNSRAELQAAVDKGKMTQATADSIQMLRQEVAAKELSLTSEKERLEAIIAVSEGEKKLAAQRQLEIVNQGLATLATQRDTVATKANSAAKRVASAVTLQLKRSFDALKASMATNPLGWIAGAIAGIAALILWIKKYKDAHDIAGKAEKQLREAHDEAAASAAREQRKLVELVEKIKTAKEHNEDYQESKQALIDQFSKYDSNLKDELQDIENLEDAYKNLNSAILQSANARAYANYSKEIQNQIDTATENISKAIADTLDENVKSGKITESERGSLLAEIQRLVYGDIDEVNRFYDKYSTYYESFRQLIYEKGSNESYAILKRLSGEYDLAEQIGDYAETMVTLSGNLKTAAAKFGVNEEELVGEEEKQAKALDDLVKNKSLKQLKESEKDLSKQLAQAREELQKSYTDDGARNVQVLEQRVKKVQDAIKAMTGKSYEDTTKFDEARVKNLQKLTNEAIRIKNGEIQDERTKRKAAYEQEIKELREAEKEYVRVNGRASGTLNKQLDNARLKFNIDISELDKQLSEWVRSKNKETDDMLFDFGISELKRAISLENDWNNKLELQTDLRTRLTNRIKDQAEEMAKVELGAYSNPDLYKAYKAYSDAQGAEAKGSVLSDYLGLMDEQGHPVSEDAVLATFADLATKETAINANKNAQLERQNQEFANEDRDMLLDMTANYLSYEEKRLAITTKYATMRKKVANDASLDEKQRAAYAEMLKRAEANELADIQDTIVDDIFDWQGIWGNFEKVSISSINRVVKRLRDAFKKVSNGEVLSTDEKGILANELGLTEQQVDDLLARADNVENVINEFFEKITDKTTQLSGNPTQDVATFFNKFKTNMEKGGSVAENFKKTLEETFTLDNLGGLLQGIGNVVNAISSGLKQIAEATDNPRLSDAADVIGGIAQNFAAAGQGAATGGWIGAVVAGVTDAIGQAFEAITTAIKGSREVLLLAREYNDELKKIRIDSLLDDKGDTIFGKNPYGSLRAAIDTLEEVRGVIRSTQQEFDNINVQDLFDALNYFDEAQKKYAWALTLAGLPGLQYAFVDDEALNYLQSLDKEYADLIETLSSGEIERFAMSMAKGNTALQSMQVRVAKFGKNKYQSLAELAPEIWNKDGSVNTDAIDAFLATYGDKLTTGQRQILESLKADVESYEKSVEQAMNYYSSLFNGVGDSLMDSFVSSFEKGEDAMDNFTDSLEDSLEQWIRDLAQMAYIQPVLQQMSDMVESAIRDGGSTDDIDNAVMGALSLLYDNFDSMEQSTLDFLAEAQRQAKERFNADIFQDEDVEATRGGFQAMSQDAADELNARFTALQIEGANVVASTTSMLSAILAMQLDVNRHTGILQNIEAYQLTAYQQAEERIGVIRAIRDNTDQILANTNRLKAIEQNTARI